MRKRIHYYAIKYQGDYNKILRAINNKEAYKEAKVTSQYITIYDKNYPKQLKALNKPPIILFYHGDLNLLNKDAISIVGSRKINTYGQRYTKLITNKLKQKFVIVSGLAIGVDTVAHNTAIKDGKSIAVLGCGINYIYPKANQDLYNTMCQTNLVISEYPDQVVPKPYFFPFRNRIIAALGKSIIVTQASLRSGTMLTVNDGLDLNKPIYVLPYRIDDKGGQGCNYLIQQGANILLIDDLEDLCNNV